jgi:hypothetical protein
VNVLPQLHVTVVTLYWGWISAFMTTPALSGRRVALGA